MRHSFVCAALLLPSPLAAAAPPTAFECRWAEAPVVLDGVADEAAWKDAPSIESFHLPWLGKAARPGRTATKAKVLWDRQYFYFFAEMEDADLFADVTAHDGDVWTNDAFELFFRPDREKPGYYEFEVSAAGTVLDAFFPKRDLDRVRERLKVGDFHLEAKRKLRGTLNVRTDVDRGWTVEGRVPWTDFLRTGGRPEPGETWGFNLCRIDYHKDWPAPELSCIAPIAEKRLPAYFHQIEDFAALTFVGPARLAAPAGSEPAEHVPLTTSTVEGSPDPPPPYKIERAYPNYRPDFPVAVRHVPGTDQMLLIVQPKASAPTVLYRFPDDPAVAEKDAVKVLETPDGGTAYDICFHPKFADNGFVYVGWNGMGPGGPKAVGVGKGRVCHITRYAMRRTPPYDLDPKSAFAVIEWESNGHNGAVACFGTDGTMYVTSGDGTSDSDTNATGQRTDLLLAKLLRIDVDRPDAGKGYSVPKDNPYVGDKRFVPETWAYGFRNPWRITCDAATGHIWVGQNGQDLWEQAYLVQKGANYGWSATEGGHPFYARRPVGPTPILKPTIEHGHAEFRSLTGGIVCRGDELPDLKGAYVYGDYSTGRVWGMKHDGTRALWHRELAITPMKITCFAENGRGELLVCDHAGSGGGGFYTLVPAPRDAPQSRFPRKLSESGLFASVEEHRMKPGVVPYSVNAPFWSDGAHKARFLAVPAGETVGFTRGRAWTFPDKAVLVKSFALEAREGDPASRKWVETRFLTKQGGEWYGYSYRWNGAGTDADLVGADGADRELAVRTAAGADGTQVWHYPSRAECMVCHGRAAGFVLGLNELQMNKDHDYGGGCVENQITGLARRGVLTEDWFDGAKKQPKAEAAKRKLTGAAADAYVAVHLPQPGQRGPRPSTLLADPPAGGYKRLADPYDPKVDSTLRARSWLHVNCATCHVEAGGGNAQIELGFAAALDKMRLIDERPIHGTFDLPEARLVARGRPESSVLLHRLGTRGPGKMPPLSTNRVDAAGLALMREWVKSLGEPEEE